MRRGHRGERVYRSIVEASWAPSCSAPLCSLSFMGRLAAPPVLRLPLVIAVLARNVWPCMSMDKRRRLDIDLRTSYRGAAQILAQLGDAATPENARHTLREELRRTLDVNTPVGPLFGKVTLQLKSGGEFVLDHIRPQALLYTLCSRSRFFAAFWRQRLLVNAGSGFLLYTDETSCGNQLRPDARRKCQALYFSHSALPTWYRARQDGWFAWAYVPAEVQNDIGGGLAQLFKTMCSDFFCGSHNFIDGIMLPSGSEWFELKCGIFAVIQDEKAHKECASLKGAGGIRPCIRCKNIVRRVNLPAGEPYMRELESSGPGAFDLHTSATFWETVDAVLHCRDDDDLLVESRKNLQIVAGLTHNEHGIIWDRAFRQIYDPIHHNVEDWMHVFLSSGGVGQYEVSGFVEAFEEHGIDPSDFDAFASKISWPAASSRFPPRFFQTRMPDDVENHCRCFASETVMAVQVLALFVLVVAERSGRLPKHCRSMLLLCQVLAIFCMQDEAVNHTDLLGHALKQHHATFLQIYGRSKCKPKMHFGYHCKDAIGRLLCNLSCFAMERKHREGKSVALHCGRSEKWTSHMLFRTTAQRLARAGEPEPFQAEHLVSPTDAPGLQVVLASMFPDVGPATFRASACQTERGFFRAGDLVVCDNAGTRVVGRCCYFAGGSLSDTGRRVFGVSVQVCAEMPGGRWDARQSWAWAPVAAILCAVPYVDLRPGMRPLLPVLQRF